VSNGRGLIVPMVRGVQFAVEVALEVGKLVAWGDRGVGRARHPDLRASSTARATVSVRVAHLFVQPLPYRLRGPYV
jgi:hypothetical protein